MRLLVTTLEFPPHVWGGLGIYVGNLARELMSRVELRVLTLEGTTPFGAGSEVPGVETIRLPVPRRRWPLRHVEFIVRANRYLRKHRTEFDVVNDHSRLIRRGPYPLVTTVHSTEAQELAALSGDPRRPALKERLKRTVLTRLSAWERRNLRQAQGLVTVGKDMVTYLQREFGHSNITLAPPGVDLDRFTPGGAERSTDVLFVGRFNARKGLVDLCSALNRLGEPLSVVLCGSGLPPDKERFLRTWVEGTHHRVRLRVDVAHAQMADLYRDARLLVVPSLYEPFGLVAVEGMACGVPVVATRVGGLQDHVRDGREGLLVPPGAPSALAEAIRAVLGDEDGRLRMAGYARRRAPRYTWRDSAEATLSAISTALEDGVRPAPGQDPPVA